MTGFTPLVREQIRAGVQSSAAVIVPLLVDIYHPRTVLDVGCGEGWFTAAFDEIPGVHALGVDHPETEVLALAPTRFVAHDLAEPLNPGPWDLAVSLEVAEHLTNGRAPGFVRDLCHAAPVVAFSAAIPGQGGVGHLNEQWPAYWAALFAANGYRTTDDLRWQIWDDDRVELWYRQNLLVFERSDREPYMPPAVVHPRLWEAYRGPS